ncbi:E3 SUMO-protein ligase SIZ1-like isoform X1 [Salvia hispanica]|uniref:E3 SUMO-protein ligase SIZ1-like isoform X1 n=1 Tax=Salvia hispanica TaxID=49212 RepID=UPI0020090942|nr:E3 SUMO-protein ligase SIZ1-like isoform X1 [Salvia hispanica]XP_047970241.1 E3 SUMO-protein ligase SIZ1-like isoform X1 [Salvia hispanica]XP_047970242.1 E3 SUMO-protein ligase SIZ1-like isoform X1 [Salvia hispanica]XP_047970243.1 E3 SUMO-protein ligase SIZ1-like isoform X1 [Salvia hispanica]
MDVVASCKDKLAYFRIKELKDVLTQLGLSKQGKKQDLVDRIIAILSDDRVSGTWAKKNAVGKDEVAKLVDDTYRKMQISGAPDLASKSKGISDGTKVKPKEEIVDSHHMDKIRCICGSTLPTDSMIKCEDPRCNVWQHIACVLIPEKPMDGVLPSPPETFYCEICRLSRADPFLVSMAHPLLPGKLNVTNVQADGSNPALSIEKTFQLTRADKDLLLKQEFDLQAWCMLLNDQVTYRMQWPRYADLQVNGIPVRAINRPGSQLLGANGRDDGPLITTCTRDGINKISLTGCDARIFCVGVRIVKRRTLHQILNLIPKEDEGERFEDALVRVCKCVGGGAATENADSDSDIEVVSDFVPVNLRCPMSGMRMKIAGRFKPCAHMGCFDLEVFVEMNQRSRKWQCPICLKNYSWEKIIIDPYFNRISHKMRDAGEDVADIEVKPDGSWRAKAEGDRRTIGELGLWHLPDGTICSSTEAESKPKGELKSVKQENGSDGHGALKIGIRKNRNGCWEVNKTDNARGVSPANRLQQNSKNNGEIIIPMSSSATGSDRDGEDGSVNQDDEGNLVFTAVNVTEYESMPPGFESPHVFNDPFTATPGGDAEVIVLSDSDEETEPLNPSKDVYKSNGAATSSIQFPASQHGIPDSFYENPAVSNGVNSCLDPYNTNDDEFGSNIWSLPPGGRNFQLFGSDAGISDPLVDMEDVTLNGQSSISGYNLPPETSMGSAALIPDSDAQLTDVDGGLVDNDLAHNGKDHRSLQIFLSARHSDDAPAMQTDLRDHPDASNGIRTEDWISLRLGDGGGGGRGQPTTANGLSSSNQLQPKDGNLDVLADHATFMLGMDGNRTGKTSRERTDSPFSFPRQRRSVRPRLYLSIDSDSE